MTIDRSTILRFIYNGRQMALKVHFSRMFCGNIPIYYCSNINNVDIIQLVSGEVFIVVNREFEEDTTEEVIDMMIWHCILRIYYKGINSMIMADTCLAYWYGFTKVTDLIKNTETNNENFRDSRILALESLLMDNKRHKIPNKDTVMDNIKYVNVAV